MGSGSLVEVMMGWRVAVAHMVEGVASVSILELLIRLVAEGTLGAVCICRRGGAGETMWVGGIKGGAGWFVGLVVESGGRGVRKAGRGSAGLKRCDVY